MKNLSFKFLFLLLIVFNFVKNNDPTLDCLETQPTKGIKDDCLEGNIIEGMKCCYMTIKYKEGTTYGCYPIEKKKSVIKEKIKELKNIYKGSKSIKIDCSSSSLKSYYALLFILIFFI